MKRYLIIIMIMLSISLGASQCDKFMEHFYGMSFSNKSSSTVSYFYVKPGGGKLYPDTLLPDTKPLVINVPSKEDRPTYLNAKYEDVFNAIPSDTMSIFVFDHSIYQNTNWTTIKEQYKVLRRYDVSLQDLKKLNFQVAYPPTPAMRHIKMFPPYEK